MPFNSLHFRRPALCRSRFIASVWAAFACLLLSGTSVAAPGQLDPTFGIGGASIIPVTPRADVAGAVAVQSDGKLVLAGNCQTTQNTRRELCLARLRTDGTPDPAFGSAGTVRTTLDGDASGNAIVVASDGKIVIAGPCLIALWSVWSSCLARYDSSGALDPTFGVGGKVGPIANAPNISITQLIETADHKWLVIGTCFSSATGNRLCPARLMNDGSLDATYGSGVPVALGVSSGIDYARHGLVQADGKLVISGYCGGSVYGGDLCAVRLLGDGQPDPTFGANGGLIVALAGQTLDAAFATEQPDHKLVFATHCARNSDSLTGLCLYRVLPDGTPDASFGQGGVVRSFVGRAANPPFAGATTDGNNYLVFWQCEGATLSLQFCVARFSSDGTPDSTFGLGGLASYRLGQGLDYATALAAAPDGKVVAVGYCDNYQTLIPGFSVYLGLEFCASRLKGGPYNPLTCALNADANQAIDTATDSLLLTRYLLGLRGDALTTGALGQNPTRTGQALENHLASLNLDADGDGQSLAMTDGLLILRAMLGLTGDALTAGAVNTAHPNARNAQQILTWIESTHGVACLP